MSAVGAGLWGAGPPRDFRAGLQRRHGGGASGAEARGRAQWEHRGGVCPGDLGTGGQSLVGGRSLG